MTESSFTRTLGQSSKMGVSILSSTKMSYSNPCTWTSFQWKTEAFIINVGQFLGRLHSTCWFSVLGMYAARHKDELENRRGKTNILRDRRCLSQCSSSFIMALWCAGPCTIVCRTKFWTYTQNRGSNSWSCHALHRRSSVHERRTGSSPKIMWRMFSYRIQILFFTSHLPIWPVMKGKIIG